MEARDTRSMNVEDDRVKWNINVWSCRRSTFEEMDTLFMRNYSLDTVMELFLTLLEPFQHGDGEP